MGIDKDKNLPTAASKLRRRAEEQLKANSPEAVPAGTGDETQRLLHELQVHQIELEMQNSELRQARDEAETSLRKYTDLYDFAPVGYFTLDRDGIIHEVNLTGSGILGVVSSRLTGRRFGHFIPGEARPAFAQFLRNVFASGARDVCDLPLLKEGPHPCFVRIEAVTDPAGQECRVAVIDITERKWSEDRLRLSEHQLAEAQKLVHLGSWQWDVVADTVTGSDELYRIFGGHFTSYEGFLQLVHPDDRDRVDTAVQETLDRLSPYDIHYRIVQPAGAVRIIHAQGAAVTDGAGRVIRMVGTVQDVSEKRLLEEKLEIMLTNLAARAAELEAANIELEAFNYTVSHDLRRPLTVINSYCQVVQELCGSTLSDECREYIREMYEGTLHMNRLIDTLLRFAQVTRVELRREQVDLSTMAQEIAMGLEMSGPERRVTFRIAEGLTAHGDAGLLRVALDNLLGNAWKYTGGQEEAVIEFGVTDIDGTTACFVRDNGPGFDMTYADKLFIPFQRIPGATVEGHGIGLATVQRIIQRHGGQIWAEGEPGRGAAFYFTLKAD